MVSRLTWLDHDPEQARRSAEIVRALSEPDTLDSIGIGAIRDGFASIFFPGTSTIQTRARYFLIVPWTMQLLEQRRPRTRTKYDDLLTEVETATIGALIAGNVAHERGIIGRQRGAKTKRKASSVYWGALEDWGIRVASGMTLSSHRSYVLSPRSAERVEAEPGDPAVFQVWDELPYCPAGFPDAPLGILPTIDEAEYLLARMTGTQAGGIHYQGPTRSSLLAAAARSPQVSDAPHFWDWPISAMPEHLRDAVLHAKFFSLAIQGARLRYLQLLFDAQAQVGRSDSVGEASLTTLVAAWLADTQKADSELRDWIPTLPAMFGLLKNYGVVIGNHTRDFVHSWLSAMVHDPVEAMTSSATATLIRKREIALKASNARLASDSALRAWDGSLLGSSPLDYRWRVAQRMLLDCRTALETQDAVA